MKKVTRNIIGILWLCLTVVPSRVFGQNTWDTQSCVEAIELPQYTTASRSALITGVVVAEISVGKDGTASKVALSPTHKSLEGEVRSKMERSRFSPQCYGKDIKLIFEFKIEGARKEGCFQSRIVFAPPNRFVIITPPPAVTVD